MECELMCKDLEDFCFQKRHLRSPYVDHYNGIVSQTLNLKPTVVTWYDESSLASERKWVSPWRAAVQERLKYNILENVKQDCANVT
jgi:hypothetical protein